MMRFPRKLILLMVLAATLLALTATVSARDLVRVRVAHLSPDTPAVEIFVNGERAFEELIFGDITGWVEIPAGTYEVAVAPRGAGPENAAIGPANLTFRAGSWTTIAAIGSLGAGTLQPAIFTESIGSLSANEASVTVFHGIEDAPAVDVITADGTPIISGLSFGEAEQITVPADVYDLFVVPSGATSPVVINLSNTSLEGATFYFVAAQNTLAAPQVLLDAVRFSAVAPIVNRRHGPSIAEIAAGDNRFDTLTTALELTGLDDVLATGGPFTVFAPTDDAFAALPAGLLDSLIADPAALTNVLLYHVVPGDLFAETVVTLDGAATVLGPGINIDVREDGVFLNGNVQVIITDIAASNGVIHVIDAVLIPPQ